MASLPMQPDGEGRTCRSSRLPMSRLPLSARLRCIRSVMGPPTYLESRLSKALDEPSVGGLLAQTEAELKILGVFSQDANHPLLDLLVPPSGCDLHVIDAGHLLYVHPGLMEGAFEAFFGEEAQVRLVQ